VVGRNLSLLIATHVGRSSLSAASAPASGSTRR
jgi:hypothetical protein